MNICKNCGKEFIKEGQKKKASYCSTGCNAAHWRRNKDKGNVAKPIINCLHCDTAFVKTRADRVYCSYKCGTYHKRGIRIKPEKQKSYSDDINEIRDFVYHIKEKRYWAEAVDIFRLIHLHTKIYPNKFYDDDEYSKEEMFSFMYKDLIDCIKN